MPTASSALSHSPCSASVVPQATWWTVPALWRPGSAGGSSSAIQPPRSSPRSSKAPSSRRLGVHQPLEQRAPCGSGAAAYARTPSKPCSASAAGISGWSAISGVVAGRVDDQLVVEALEVGEAQDASSPRSDAVPSRGEALLPEVERRGGGDAPDDPVHHPGAGPAGLGVRVLEEGQVGAGAGLLVAVEEVVDGRVVLVDGLGGQPQAEDARVEVDVARRVAGDRGDVVDAVELHGTASGLLLVRASIAVMLALSTISDDGQGVKIGRPVLLEEPPAGSSDSFAAVLSRAPGISSTPWRATCRTMGSARTLRWYSARV